MVLPSGDQPLTTSSAESNVSHGGDDEDVVAAVPVGAEGDHAAVGAEDRIDVVGLMHGHGTSDAADGLDGPDIAEVAEGNQPAVGRDVRRAAEAYRFLSTNAGKAQKRRRQSGQKRTEGMHGGGTLLQEVNSSPPQGGRQTAWLLTKMDEPFDAATRVLCGCYLF